MVSHGTQARRIQQILPGAVSLKKLWRLDLMTPVHSTISVIVTSMLSMSSLLSEENTFFTTIWI